MKIKFHCNTCSEHFHIVSKYLTEKESVACPNCESKFPSDSFEQLKQGVALIVDSRSKMKLEEMGIGYTRRFDFVIIDS